MSKQEYPDYIYRMMDEAARLLAVEDDPDPWEAAALCFDILAAFPEHEAARELILKAYRDGRLIVIKQLTLIASGVSAFLGLAFSFSPLAPSRLTPEGHRPLDAVKISTSGETRFYI